jgi:hypothetical protein
MLAAEPNRPYVWHVNAESCRMRLLAVLLLLVAAPLAAHAGSAGLAAHQAVYALSLDPTRGGDVAAVTGEMAYEVTDACDGWAVRQRLQMMVTNREGTDVDMVSDYLTWESKDGTKLRFHMKQTTDSAVTEQVEGEASLSAPGGPGVIHYTMPELKTTPVVAGTLFPMAHTAAIIAAADAGKKFLTLPLFDGTGADGVQNTSVVVVNWNKEGSAAPYPALAELPSGRVRVAFFARNKDATKPEYEVGMRYWSNGVADGLNMDFADFVVNGKLTSFTLPPAPHC